MATLLQVRDILRVRKTCQKDLATRSLRLRKMTSALETGHVNRIPEPFALETRWCEAQVVLPQVLGKRAEKNCCKSGLVDYINSNRLSCQVLAQVGHRRS